MTDCKFYEKGLCQRGVQCSFRHQKFSVTTDICADWIAYRCESVMCPKRHPATVPSEVQKDSMTNMKSQPASCKFFLLGRCKNMQCIFSHDLPDAEHCRATFRDNEKAATSTKRTRYVKRYDVFLQRIKRVFSQLLLFLFPISKARSYSRNIRHHWPWKSLLIQRIGIRESVSLLMPQMKNT